MMNTKYNTQTRIGLDLWDHSELSEKIINYIKLKHNKHDSAHIYNAIPNIKKPYFWQFKKMKAYKAECDRIYNECVAFIDKTNEYC